MRKSSIKLGITGSIGMGKTTVAREIAKYNYPVWNSDDVVHELYTKGGDGYKLLKAFIPEVVNDFCVDRQLLSDALLLRPMLLKEIEDIIHPLVERERKKFLHKYKSKEIIIFDIPLLFETNTDKWIDFIIVVTAPPEVQRQRVLSRQRMTESKFLYILSQQLGEEEKLERADYIINTDCNYTELMSKIKIMLEKLQNDYN